MSKTVSKVLVPLAARVKEKAPDEAAAPAASSAAVGATKPAAPVDGAAGPVKGSQFANRDGAAAMARAEDTDEKAALLGQTRQRGAARKRLLGGE